MAAGHLTDAGQQGLRSRKEAVNVLALALGCDHACHLPSIGSAPVLTGCGLQGLGFVGDVTKLRTKSPTVSV